MCSFISDDRGFTGPYTDTVAIGIVGLGLILFGFLVLEAYSAYAGDTYQAAARHDVRTIAGLVLTDPGLTYRGRPGVFDAAMLDSGPEISCYGYPGGCLSVEIDSYERSWHMGRMPERNIASYRTPVTVRLNDARSVGAIMIVKTGDPK